MGKTVEEIARKITSDVFKQEGQLGRTLTHPELGATIAAAIRKDRAEPVSEEEVERFGQEMASIVDEEWPPKREPEEARKYARIICEAARKARTE